MSAKNKISAEITPEQVKASADTLATFRANLSHVLTINLKPDERRNMLKMGDKTLAFVQKALEYATQNPSLVPAFMDLTEAKKDYALTAELYNIYQQLYTLITAIEDTGMVAGGEAYEAALIFYHSVKGASRSDVAGAQAVYNDLSQRFPGQRRSRATATPA